jgi:hypothetical protein
MSCTEQDFIDAYLRGPWRIKLPAWDGVNKRPNAKMPNCPRCDEDELGMIEPTGAYCYSCCLHVLREE